MVAHWNYCSSSIIIALTSFSIFASKKKEKAKEQALADVQLTETLVVPSLNAAQETEDEKASRELLRIQNEKSMELKDNIRKFAEDNPEISAQLIKTWLRGGEDNA